MSRKPGDLPFWDLCRFFDRMQQAPVKQRGKIFANFQEQVIPQHDPEVWQIYRLLLPKEDETRGNYGFKEQSLSKVLVQACNLDPNANANANKAINWRRGSGKSAGNFPAAMEEFLFKNHCGKEDADSAAAADKSGARVLTVAMLNEKLDEIVGADGGADKKETLRYLMHMCTPRMARWITALIIKELKAGITENQVFRHLHPDAEHLYNATMSLHAVVTQLTDRTKRLPRKDLEPGQPARPMLAAVAKSVEYAHSKLHGHPAVVETKFDGERMQMHFVEGRDVQWFSRQGHEHGGKSGYEVLDAVARRQCTIDNLVLDGELIVWRPAKRMFEHFGGLKSAIHAARDGRSGDALLEVEGADKRAATDPDYTIPKISELQITYLVFDVLYYKDQSVINRTLLERQQLLRDAIRAAPPEGFPLGNLSARMVLVLPGEPFLEGPPASRICNTVDDIREALEEATRLKEEGIVVKDTTSPWKMNDRGTAWQKIKPDYVETPDIDAVIVGAHYGRGRRGGALSEFLLALALGSRADGRPPTEFITFCRVGTGHSDAERQAIANHLEGNLQAAKPRSLVATGTIKEKPDLWVRDINKSVVVMIKGDVRLIHSSNFATDYSMRFPTVVRTRWDKPPAEVQTHEELKQLVQQRIESDAIVRPSDGGGGRHFHHRGAATTKRFARQRSGPAQEKVTPVKKAHVMDQFLPTDLSGVAVEAHILGGLTFAFCDYGSAGKAEVESLVTRLGGKVMQSYTPSPTTYLLSSGRGIRCRAARDQGHDIISLKWLYECAAERDMVPLMPRHYMNISRATLESMSDVSRFGDPFYLDVGEQDMRAILELHTRLADIDVAELAAAAAGAPTPGAAGSPAASPAKARSLAAKRAAAMAATDPMPILRALAAELSQHGGADGSAAANHPGAARAAAAAEASATAAGGTLFLGCKVATVQLPAEASAVAPAAASAEGGAAATAGEAATAASPDGGRERHSRDGQSTGAGAAPDALSACIARRLAAQVQLHGGSTSPQVDATTTHLVLLDGGGLVRGSGGGGGGSGSSGDAADQLRPVDPAALLAAVSDQLGGVPALRALRSSLQDGRMQLVTPRWIEDSVAAVAARSMPPPADALPPLLRAAAAPDEPADDPERWPWAEFGVRPQASPARAPPAKRRTPMAKGSSTPRAAALGRGRGRPLGGGRGRGRKAAAPAGKRKRGASPSPDADSESAAEPDPASSGSRGGSSSGDIGGGDSDTDGFPDLLAASPPAGAAKKRRAAAARAGRARRRGCSGKEEVDDDEPQLADADAAGGGATAHRRRAAHRIDDEDEEEGLAAAGAAAAPSDAAALPLPQPHPQPQPVRPAADGGTAARQKPSLMDALLGPSLTADDLTPEPIASLQPGRSAQPAATPPAGEGFMSSSGGGGGGGGHFGGSGSGSGNGGGGATASQHVRPAKPLKDRLRELGMA